MSRSRSRSDISNEMNETRTPVSRLTRYLYETRTAFVFAILAALVVVSAFGIRARAELACTSEAIATGSAACAGQAAPAAGAGAEQSIRFVFRSAP